MRENTKPRVAIIGLKGLPAFGGAAVVGEHLIKKLKDDFDLTVLSVASHAGKSCTEIDGVPQIVFKNFGKGGFNTFMYYLISLWHVLINKYDIVHLHHAESGFITPLLRIKYKVVVTFHGIYKKDYKDPKFNKLQNWFFKFSERLNIKYANIVVSVSLPDKLYIEQLYRREVEYIPNGVDLGKSIFLLDTINRPAGYILFAAGRIYEIKGLHLLLSALRKGQLKIPLKIVGDMDQVPEYREMIMEEVKGLNSEFLGLIKNKSDLMHIVASAKYFVFPSLTEAMSMMLLEVVSMKTPIIASDIPANKAIFDNNEVLFFKNDDSDDLLVKIKYAETNPMLLKTMAEKAYQKLASKYTWDSISLKYQKLYKTLLA